MVLEGIWDSVSILTGARVSHGKIRSKQRRIKISASYQFYYNTEIHGCIHKICVMETCGRSDFRSGLNQSISGGDFSYAERDI